MKSSKAGDKQPEHKLHEGTYGTHLEMPEEEVSELLRVGHGTLDEEARQRREVLVLKLETLPKTTKAQRDSHSDKRTPGNLKTLACRRVD